MKGESALRAIAVAFAPRGGESESSSLRLSSHYLVCIITIIIFVSSISLPLLHFRIYKLGDFSSQLFCKIIC